MNEPTYAEKLAAWKIRHGFPSERAAEDFSPGERRMIAEDAQATGTSYCWKCGGEYPIRELVLETSPYHQMTDDIADDGYIPPHDRVRKCKPCAQAEANEDAQAGMDI